MLTVLQGDALQKLRELPDESVQCCVTSPPYWALRDYGVEGQIGLESTIEEYLEKMVTIFQEVKRVLRSDGTVWINLGDTYAGGGNGGGGAFSSVPDKKGEKRTGEPGSDKNVPMRKGSRGVTIKSKRIARGSGRWGGGNAPAYGAIKPKDLIGVPWRVAFALQADGWYLRSDIIWHKPNPMPESVADRPTKAHEYLFLLSKSEKYYYDADSIRTPYSDNTKPLSFETMDYSRRVVYKNGPNQKVPSGWDTRSGSHGNYHKEGRARGHNRTHEGFNKDWDHRTKEQQLSGGANKRTVWTVATKPYHEAHFATFPPDLIKPCILAGTPPNGVVLDPFGGSGTTGAVALELGRQAVLIELNPQYVELIRRRCAVTPGLPLG